MFQGFYEQTVDFLWGIRMNNERSWYALHKGECAQYLTRPMNELAREVHDMFSEKHPYLDLNVHMSRIYRDARRNYGKGPYKDYLWFTLYDAKFEHWSSVPSFWFEIGADYWTYGVGCWDDRTAFMRKMRARIKAAPEKVRELNRILEGQNEFILTGEFYKKQYADCPYPDLEGWYRRKGISISHEESVGPAILGSQFGDRIKEGMLFLTPFYEFICDVRNDPDPDAPEEYENN
ncbi:MAG: DUF2461 domain-containing protein [Oscillospiraceae bacterium]|nr:DUF2461 domain-containing protein [Oscillospiraceae bacterium]